MKKIVCIMVFMTCVLYAMDDQKMENIPPKIIGALKELQHKESYLNNRIVAEKKKNQNSVPDFFGVMGKCSLPESLECCKDPLLRSQFLKAIKDQHVRNVIIVNWLGHQSHQGSISSLSAGILMSDNRLSNLVLGGIDFTDHIPQIK